MPPGRVEVHARGRRDVGLLEEAPAQGDGIVGEAADVGVEVERAVRGGEAVEPSPMQLLQEEGAVGAIALDARLQFGQCLESSQSRVLRHGRRRDEQVLPKPAHGVDQILRQHEPAQAPARHAEILGEAVDDDGVLAERQDRLGRLVVGDAVIDLIRDDPYAPAAAPAGKTFQIGARDHRAGGIGRAGQDEAVDRARDGRQQVGSRLEAGLHGGGNRHHLDVERGQDVAVGRIAGFRDRDACPGVEGGQERQDEPARGPDGRSDPGRVDLDAVDVAVMSGDPLAQGGQPEGLGVAAAPLRQGSGGGGHGGGRGAARGLADLEVQNVGAGGRTGVRCREDVHDDERCHRAADRCAERLSIAHALLLIPFA